LKALAEVRPTIPIWLKTRLARAGTQAVAPALFLMIQGGANLVSKTPAF
jgi:hypothetical protein